MTDVKRFDRLCYAHVCDGEMGEDADGEYVLAADHYRIVAELRTDYEDAFNSGEVARSECDILRAEVEALRKDAELFRRLRDLPDELLGAPGVPCVAVPDGPSAGQYVSGLDLDAAMEASR